MTRDRGGGESSLYALHRISFFPSILQAVSGTTGVPGAVDLFYSRESDTFNSNELSQKMFFFLLPVVALLLSRETAGSGNSNEKWLSTVAQYKDRSWNRFRDVDYFKCYRLTGHNTTAVIKKAQQRRLSFLSGQKYHLNQKLLVTFYRVYSGASHVISALVCRRARAAYQEASAEGHYGQRIMLPLPSLEDITTLAASGRIPYHPEGLIPPARHLFDRCLGRQLPLQKAAHQTSKQFSSMGH
nr:PREDICTED: uncharacterized protein LOC104951741 [Notothenia coriiceps]